MVTKKKLPEKFPSATPPNPEQFNPLVVINKYLPERYDRKRKIHFLFSIGINNYYRINFHNTENQNYIAESYFTEINRNTLKLVEL